MGQKGKRNNYHNINNIFRIIPFNTYNNKSKSIQFLHDSISITIYKHDWMTFEILIYLL